MTACCRPVFVALLLAGLPGMAVAQTSGNVVAVPNTQPSSSAGGLVDSPQLKNFSLPGTVTHSAAPVETAPSRPARGRAPAPSPIEPSATPLEAVPDLVSPTPTRRQRTPAVVSDQPSSMATAPTRPSTPSSQPPVTTLAPPADLTAPAPQSLPLDTSVLPPSELPAGHPWWPWLLALLVAGAAGAWWWRRQAAAPAMAGGDLGYALGGGDLAVPRPAPTPRPPVPRAPPAQPRAPAPAPPAPASARAPSIPGAIVATRLAPSIEFMLAPQSLAIDGEQAVLTFDVAIANAGTAPARDVLVEAVMVNAGPTQDSELAAFFERPAGTGDRIPAIMPLGSVSLTSRLVLPLGAFRPLEIEGRSLMVPMVGLSAHYRGSAGELQSATSFLVGRGSADAARLAPFRLDRGPRSWRGLSARLHSLGLQR